MKKAQEEIMFVFSLILISLVLTLGFIVCSIAGKNTIEEKITALESNEININLLNYLRTNDAKTNFMIADLITYSYHKDNYDDLERVTKEFFDKYHDKDKCQTIFIAMFDTKDDKKLFEALSRGEAVSTRDKFSLKSTSIILPTFDDNKIKINYAEGCKNE